MYYYLDDDTYIFYVEHFVITPDACSNRCRLGYPDITENPRTVIIGDYNSPAYSATKFTVGPTGSYSKIGVYGVQIDQ